MSNCSSGFSKQAILPEIRVITDSLTSMVKIKEVFDRHQFEWMNAPQGYYGERITQEFYAAYATIVLNSITGKSLRKKRKELALKLPPLQDVQIIDVWVDIFEAIILRFLHDTKYTPHLMGLYEYRHHLAMNKEQIKDPTSRADILRWIAQQISIEGTEASWVINSR